MKLIILFLGVFVVFGDPSTTPARYGEEKEPSANPRRRISGPGSGTSADWSYCSDSSPCTVGQGDCDADSHCAGSLTCGQNNCKDFNPRAETEADCCTEVMKIELTVDNAFLIYYVSSSDSILALLPIDTDWYTTSYKQVPADAKYLIVAATNQSPGAAGIILSSSNTPDLVTDGSWRCQGQGYTDVNWSTWPGDTATVSYIERSYQSGDWNTWPYAVVQANGAVPWTNQIIPAGISNLTQWIWSDCTLCGIPNSAMKVLCIKKLG